MAKKQISARLDLAEYAALDNWRQCNGGANYPESRALLDLADRFFEGGNRRELTYRLQVAQAKLDNLLSKS